MRQMNGINQMEQDRYNRAGRAQDNLYNNAAVDVGKGQGAVEVPSFSYEKSKAEKVKTGSLMDNFDEYRKQKLEQDKENFVDEEEIAKEQRERAKELAASLSDEELQMLQSMGLDIESVKLSDLQGIISTMRQENHKEEIRQILQNSQMDMQVGLQTGLQIESMPQEDMKFSLSNDELVYLLRNDLPATKENLIKAHFSGSRMQEKPVAQELFAPMQQQIEAIIEQTGYEVSEDSLAGAKVLLANNLPITPDTMKQYLDYQAILGNTIDEVDIPVKTEQLISDKAEQLMEAVGQISDEAVVYMSNQGRPVTIAAALTVEKEIMPSVSKEAANVAEKTTQAASYEAVKQMRMLQELRLTMTVEAANRLVTKDFNIDTKTISKVVDELREIEQQMLSYMMREEEITNPEQTAQLYFETKNMVAGIADAPAAILALPLRQGTFTIQALHAEAKAISVEAPKAAEAAGTAGAAKAAEAGFETVRRSYEAVQTAPRYDLGDRISKAFSNIEEMLGEMNLEVNEDNVRAVRILGYNSMEITEQNIAKIVSYDREVNELISHFSPATVLAVIKEGANPMDEPIEDLNRRLRARNHKGAVTDTDNFASYLRDMEKQGVVNAKERESYIGLYRVMNQLAKSGNREAGYLFASGANLTIRNLISAMRSAKASGIDVSVDEKFGMLKARDVQGKRMDEQIEGAFDKETIAARVQDMTEETVRYMEENAIEQSLVNASAIRVMLHSQGGIYSVAYNLLGKLSGYKNASEDAVDEESENMTDSLMGEEIPVTFEAQTVLEQLANGPLMSEYYEELENSLTGLLYEAGTAKTIATEDISMMKTVQAGFRIMSGLARNNKFQIPLETETGIQVVNLSFERGELRGAIDISMNSEKLGRLKGQFVLGKNGLIGQLISDTSTGNFELQSLGQEFAASLEKEGIPVDEVRLGSVAERPMEAGTFDAKDTYSTMVSIVKTMRGFV